LATIEHSPETGGLIVGAVEHLRNEKYVALTTFRRNGTPVVTPVWFAIDNDKLYVYSEHDAGKMKRVRATGKVEVAPCTMRGAITGDAVPGTAIALEVSRGSYVHGLLNKKYGLIKRLFELGTSIPTLLRLKKKGVDGFIEITLD
jgi:uncharacterized protein